MTYVKVTTQADYKEALDNGYALRELVNGKYPGLAQAWVDSNFKTPRPQPVPVPIPTPPSTNPSGFTPPAPVAGYTRSLDDFLTTSWSSLWTGRYNGPSQGFQQGIFLDTHAVLKGDSLLRLEAYPDPANALNSWEATPAIVAAVNGWCGAGVQTVVRWPVGTIFTWAMKWDVYDQIASIALTMGKTWPPEQDIVESSGGGVKPITNLTGSFHYTKSNGQTQLGFKGTDFSDWHVWQLQWTQKGSVVTCDGQVVMNLQYTPAMTADSTYGLLANQFFSFQCQTGDPGNPPADLSITAANPITTYVDWFCVDTPTVGQHLIEQHDLTNPAIHGGTQ